MKLRGLTKLALSGVALAAVAATLGTSTYAWYVTNSKATASGVQGHAKAGGLGNVLVAEASTASGAVAGHGAFVQDLVFSSANVTFDGSTATTSTAAAAGLLPTTPVTAALASGAALSTLVTDTEIDGSTVWVGNKGATMTTNKYITFDLWVLSTDAEDVTMTYTISNTTATDDVVKQLAYNNTGIPTGASEGQEFAVNIVDALKMSMSVSDAVIGASDSTQTSQIYDVAAAASTTSTTYTGFKSGGKSNEYYAAVLADTDILGLSTTGSGANITATANELVAGVSTKTTNLHVTKNTAAKLTFYIWLEGTDNQCFDSCSGQAFEIAFQFSTASQNNNNNSGNGGN